MQAGSGRPGSSAIALSLLAKPPDAVAPFVASGAVLAGSNCTVAPATDLDSFQFNASSGDSYLMTVAMDGGGYPNNICLELWDPSQKGIYLGCSDSLFGQSSVVTFQNLSVSGLYTMSLQRVHPTPLDGRTITLGLPVSDEINPLTDTDAFTFTGVTTGTYRITASIASGGFPSNLCAQVFRPDGTYFPGQCTDSLFGQNSVQMDVTPLQNGTHVLLLWESTRTGTIGYNLNIACLVGNCGPGPTCTLKDTLSYDAASGTLTMNFTVGHRFAATWNGWLTYQNTMESLWSEAQPRTDPPVSVTKTRTNLPKVGKVGVLSTLTTPVTGITCTNWTLVDTGTP